MLSIIPELFLKHNSPTKNIYKPRDIWKLPKISKRFIAHNKNARRKLTMEAIYCLQN